MKTDTNCTTPCSQWPFCVDSQKFVFPAFVSVAAAFILVAIVIAIASAYNVKSSQNKDNYKKYVLSHILFSIAACLAGGIFMLVVYVYDIDLTYTLCTVKSIGVFLFSAFDLYQLNYFNSNFSQAKLMNKDYMPLGFMLPAKYRGKQYWLHQMLVTFIIFVLDGIASDLLYVAYKYFEPNACQDNMMNQPIWITFMLVFMLLDIMDYYLSILQLCAVATLRTEDYEIQAQPVAKLQKALAYVNVGFATIVNFIYDVVQICYTFIPSFLFNQYVTMKIYKNVIFSVGAMIMSVILIIMAMMLKKPNMYVEIEEDQNLMGNEDKQ